MSKKQMEFDQSLLDEVSLDSKEAERVVKRLGSYILSEPDPLSTQQLVNALTPYLPKAREKQFRDLIQNQKLSYDLGYLAQLGFAQVSPRSIPFWWLAVVLTLLGSAWHSILAAQYYAWPPLLLAMPLLAIAATSWIFRPRERALAEIEATCPVGPQQVALAQLFVTLLNVTVLAIPATVLVSIYDPSTAILSLLFGWLAPMLLFTALNLQVSIYAGGLAGLVAGMAAWGLYVFSFLMEWSLLAPPLTTHQWLINASLLTVAVLLLAFTSRNLLPERRQFNA